MFIDQATFQLINQSIRNKGWIDLPAEGTSMYPLIKNGDLCRFILCEPHSLKRADIALFYTRMGELVAHRFYYKQLSDDRIVFHFKGDTNLGFDGPVSEEQIIGKLTMIHRAQRKISVEKPAVFLWGKLIMTLPILSSLLNKYLHRKSHFQSGVPS